MTNLQATYRIQGICTTSKEYLLRAMIFMRWVRQYKAVHHPKQGSKREMTLINLKIIAIIGTMYTNSAKTWIFYSALFGILI